LASMSEADRNGVGRAFLELPHAPSEPSYHGMVISGKGELWLGDYPGPEALLPNPLQRMRLWTLFGPNGVRNRRVQSPPGYRLMAVEDGRVRPDAGQPHTRGLRYGLRRGETSTV